MILLQPGDTIAGQAGAAASITVTVYGHEATDQADALKGAAKPLYQGQVPNAATVLYTVGANPPKRAAIRHIVVVNPTAGAVSIKLWQGGTTDPFLVLPAISLLAGAFAVWADGTWTFYDSSGRAQAGPFDVTDRAGRLLGVVASITAPVDVSDRAGRALGAVSPAAASLWDVSDRAGRAVGAVSPAAASVWDVADRVGRALGVVASITAPVDVSDRAGRLVGVVDTELPAAAALADATANPTVPLVGTANELWNGATWDRARSGGDNADAIAAVAAGILRSLAENMGFNGATWDRMRSGGDNADGLAGLAAGIQRVLGEQMGWDGAAWNRILTASITNLGLATTKSVPATVPYTGWSMQNAPAVATAATVSRAAGGVGVRHVCLGGFIGVACAATAQTILRVNLIDGATGGATLLQRFVLSAPVNDSCLIPIGPFSIMGSLNTAMTIESAAAPVAGAAVFVNLWGYSTT